MNNQTQPEVVEQWRAEFSEWFAETYLCTIQFDGKGWIAPPLGGRSQGKSVALTANVAWAAWVKSRKSVCVEIPPKIKIKMPCANKLGEYMAYNDALRRAKILIKSQGYQVRVKGE